jgi:gamma-glutamyltranspeptidase/glutathione hydrolase
LLKLSQKEAQVFYRGEIASAIQKAISDAPVHPALLTKNDLKNYAVIERDPVYGHYRGLDIFVPSLPTAGGVTLFENLNILETFDLSELSWDSTALHYLNEAQNLAFQNRQRLGDPGFSEINVDTLISKEHGKENAKNILPEKTMHQSSTVPEDGKQTSHLSIVDRLGNLVSWTSTIEAPFGSGITVPGYGFLLNNEMTDFDSEPKDANDQLRPNAPGAGKRPLSSMTPVIVFNKGKPFMILGSPGGTTIIGTVLNVIVNHIDFGMTCEEAVAKPRLIFRGGKSEMEPELYNHPLIRLQLELWGHDSEKVDVIGNAQTICFDDTHQEIVGVSDSRGIGKASGY